MDKKKFGELISERLEPMIPNTDYVSVLFKKDELPILLSALQEYKVIETCYMNHDRVELIQSLIDRLLLCK